jgi:hypothetical protein
MNKLASRMLKLKILISIFVERSVEARPSVSIRIMFTSAERGTGRFHIQIPLVQAYVVLPISKPLL